MFCSTLTLTFVPHKEFPVELFFPFSWAFPPTTFERSEKSLNRSFPMNHSIMRAVTFISRHFHDSNQIDAYSYLVDIY